MLARSGKIHARVQHLAVKREILAICRENIRKSVDNAFFAFFAPHLQLFDVLLFVKTNNEDEHGNQEG